MMSGISEATWPLLRRSSYLKCCCIRRRRTGDITRSYSPEETPRSSIIGIQSIRLDHGACMEWNQGWMGKEGGMLMNDVE